MERPASHRRWEPVAIRAPVRTGDNMNHNIFAKTFFATDYQTMITVERVRDNTINVFANDEYVGYLEVMDGSIVAYDSHDRAKFATMKDVTGASEQLALGYDPDKPTTRTAYDGSCRVRGRIGIIS